MRLAAPRAGLPLSRIRAMADSEQLCVASVFVGLGRVMRCLLREAVCSEWGEVSHLRLADHNTEYRPVCTHKNTFNEPAPQPGGLVCRTLPLRQAAPRPRFIVDLHRCTNSVPVDRAYP